MTLYDAVLSLLNMLPQHQAIVLEAVRHGRTPADDYLAAVAARLQAGATPTWAISKNPREIPSK